jgi:uncharacterized protein (TIGR04255 family)
MGSNYLCAEELALKGMHVSYEERFGPLPHYRKPPVVETAIAVEFAPLPGWTLLNYGTMWEEFRADYPTYEIQPYFPASAINAKPFDLSLASPPIRCFFLTSDGSQLVQSRSGAFVKNWRARPGNEEYPRYATIRPSFVKDFQTFQSYLSQNGLPALEVWKCEVTYVNHLFQGREWADAASLSLIFPTIGSAVKPGLLGSPTNVRYAAGYELPDNDGSLQFEMLPGTSPDGRNLIQLSITAAGPPKSSNIDDIMDWMDKGRYAVVKSFSEFTAEEVQTRIWERL